MDENKQILNDIESAYPLTMLQAGMIFHSELSTETAVYHDIFTYYMVGTYNFKMMFETLEQLIASQPVLRTSFDLGDFSEPLQLVHQKVKVPLVERDIREISYDEHAKLLIDWIEEEKHRPFDWKVAPLFRMFIHRSTDKEFNISISFHHSIMDGWSVATMMTEFLNYYICKLKNTKYILDTSKKVCFRDYVALELKAIKSKECKEYWLDNLDESTFTVMPRWPMMRNQNGHGKNEIIIPYDISEGLYKLTKSEGVPLKNILLAAHMRVISLITGENDIITGIVSNGRPEETGSEGILGLFLNTIPFRMILTKGNWREHIRQTFENEQEMIPYRRYPLSKIITNIGKTTLFETVFNFTNFHSYKQLIKEKELLQVSNTNVFEQTNFPFLCQFSVDPITNRIQLSLIYDSVEFCAEQIESISRYYINMLKSIVKEPDISYKVSEIGMINNAEKNQLLDCFNNTHAEYRKDKTIHEIFEEQVLRTPENNAVTFGGKKLSYQELNEKANKLARTLRKKGVKPDSIVGIMVERSLEMMIGIFAILKAGGAYVPIDPEYPKERIHYILEDSMARVLLTQNKFMTNVSFDKVLIDLNSEISYEDDGNNLEVVNTSSNLAYVIYTSGSTGKPKGVMIEHHSVINRISWMNKEYPIDQKDVILQKTTYTFDVSVWELLWWSFVGASVCLLENKGEKDPEMIINSIENNNVTVMHFVPSMFNSFLYYVEISDNINRISGLKQIFCSGERLLVKHVEMFNKLTEKLRNIKLINLYGPTEATVDVSYFECIRKKETKYIPIGKPIDNIKLYILGNNKELRPLGLAGELCISGVGLARGYLNNIDLTNEKFINNPFILGVKMYMTGDLARWMPDGNIEYLGRIDSQVKIRGFRIELGEIEAVIRKYFGIKNVVVTAKKVNNDSENKRLIVYVVAEKGIVILEKELRDYLSEKLPSYMIPSVYVMLDEIPLTANGKVNIKALPEPEHESYKSKEEYVAPVTSVEKLLFAAWSKALGIKKIGVNDNFFNLGGDSILSIQLVAYAKKQGLNLNIQQLFKYPTISKQSMLSSISEVAATSEDGKEENQIFGLLLDKDRVKLTSEKVMNENKQVINNIESAYPLTMFQSEMFSYSELSTTTAVYHDIFTYYFVGAYNFKMMHEALKQLIFAHPILRTSFDLGNYSEPIQLVNLQVKVPLEERDIRKIPYDKHAKLLAEWVQEEGHKPFNLISAPLLRMIVHRSTDEEFSISISFHHSILDGWSVATMMTEFVNRYTCNLKNTKHIQGTLKKVCFRDYVALELKAIKSIECKKYWLDKLDRSTFTKIPRWTTLEKQGGHSKIELIIPSDVSEGLYKFAKSEEVPLKNILLAAHLRVISLISKKNDIVAGVVSSGRPEEAGSEELLGIFINILPFRIILTKGNWREHIKETFENEQDMIPYRRYPFQELATNIGKTSLFETVFNFTNFHVYNKVNNTNGLLQVLGLDMFEEVTFPFYCLFSVDSITNQIQFSLVCDSSEFCDEQVMAIARYYTRMLKSIVNEPDIQYDSSHIVSEKEACEINIEIKKF